MRRNKASIIGWLLRPADRLALLDHLPPAYPDILAHHVTKVFDAPLYMALPAETDGIIIGRVDDSLGIEAMVVSIGGKTDRGDGSAYHITWSLDRGRGRRPVESNAVIARLGWQPVEPIPIRLQPARF